MKAVKITNKFSQLKPFVGISACVGVSLLSIGTTNAQTKIGGAPGPSDSSAYLQLGDATGANRGLLLSRVALTGTTSPAPLASMVPGMMVYNTATAGTAPNNVTPGMYYCDGTKWVRGATTAVADGDAWGVNGEDQATTISRTGSVGIGAIPTQALQVGPADPTGPAPYALLNGLRVSGGDVGNTIYQQKANTNIGITLNSASATNTVGLGSAITGLHLLVTGAGNVGVGTATPTQKLDINGTTLMRGGGGGVFNNLLYFGFGGGSDYKHAINSSHHNTSAAGNAIGFNLWTPADAIGAAPSKRVMTLTGDGNVEIANQIKLNGGNPGPGKVLTSDANGLASWQTIAENVTAGSNKVILGGTPTGAVLKPFSVDVDQTKLRLDSISGKINLTQINNGGAVNNQTLVWSSTNNNWVVGDAPGDGDAWGVTGENQASDITRPGRVWVGSSAAGSVTLSGGSGSTTGYLGLYKPGNILLGYIGNNGTDLVYTAQSGVKHVFNGGNVEIANQIKISGGSPGPGKVLTSDANGLATWTSPNPGADGDAWNVTGEDATSNIARAGSIGIGSPATGSIVLSPGSATTTGYMSLYKQNGTILGNIGNIGTNIAYNAQGGANHAFNGGNVVLEKQIQILGGSPGPGKLLTSDANGLATWQTLTGNNLTSAKVAGTSNLINIVNGTGATLTNAVVQIDTLQLAYTIKNMYNTPNSPIAADWYKSGTTLAAGNTDDQYVMGKVGIGTSTPTARLQVAGTGEFEVRVGNSNNGAQNLLLGTVAASGTTPAFSAINSVSQGVTFNNLVLNNHGGYVGVGLNTPTDALHVSGAIKSGGATGGFSRLQPGGGSNAGYLEIFKADGTNRLGYIGFDNTHLRYASENGAQHWFAGGNVVVENNVGIGTATPGAKLEVAGQVKITGGNPGANKVLTSDANGLATWQPSSNNTSVYTNGVGAPCMPVGSTLSQNVLGPNGALGMISVTSCDGLKLLLWVSVDPNGNMRILDWKMGGAPATWQDVNQGNGANSFDVGWGGSGWTRYRLNVSNGIASLNYEAGSISYVPMRADVVFWNK